MKVVCSWVNYFKKDMCIVFRKDGGLEFFKFFRIEVLDIEYCL